MVVRSLVLTGLAFVATVLVTGCAEGEDAEGGQDDPSLEGTPWVLLSGIPLPQDVAVVMPTATFADGTVGGSMGCNRYSGSYEVDGDRLELGPLASTQMACAPPADGVERAFVAALTEVTRWRIDDGELVLAAEDGATELRFEVARLTGSWRVTGYLRGTGVTSPVAGTELSARFGEDGRLSGSAGCNRYTGSYDVDGDTIEVEEPATTRKLCVEPPGVMEQEAAFLAVLPTAVRYRLDGSSLELLSADGTRVVSLVRA